MAMKKIVMVPLDERPCNYKYPLAMPSKSYNLVLPPREILGDKKRPSDFAALKAWLFDNLSGAYGLILSVDMLLYGGIVPSRLHFLSDEEISARLGLIDEIRTKFPSTLLYGFQLIMRCPWYPSSDEEPDYYDECGSNIFYYGYYDHLEREGLLTAEQKILQKENLAKIKPEYLEDYLSRRQKNIRALKITLEKVKAGIFDYFVVPQDDSEEFGMTTLDQSAVRDFIKQNGLQAKAGIYPGADEVGLTLLSRLICKIHNVRPKFFVHYASSRGAFVVPSMEDRIIDETIKYQISAAGGLRVYSLAEADILAAVNIGSASCNVAAHKRSRAFDIERNLFEFVEQMKYALEQGKAVAVCDVGLDGGDVELVKLMCDEGIMFGVNSYSGWNTSSNTIGTAFCQCIASMYEPDAHKNSEFLLNRILEDACYIAHVKKIITDRELPGLGLNYFDAGGSDGAVASLVRSEIMTFARGHLPQIYDRIGSLSVRMPWRRMFEVELDAQLKA